MPMKGGSEGWRDGGMEGWRDGGMEGWRDGWMDGWMDGWIESQVGMFSIFAPAKQVVIYSRSPFD